MPPINTQAKTRLRDMRVFHASVSSPSHAAIVPEVQHALDAWDQTQDCVLIGGLALSFYSAPRYTQDIDLLFLSKGKVPDAVASFKRVRPHSFQERQTHVEVEVLTPEFLSIPKALVEKVFHTAVKQGRWKVASREGLIALKLQRGNRQDQADIEKLVLKDTDMTDWPLSPKGRQLFDSIKQEVHPAL
jgi:hypothetical protein